MEDEAKALKERRSKLKNNITLTSKKIATVIKRTKTIEEVQVLLEEIDSLFNNFTEAHLEYCDIIDNDSNLESYKVVSGLDLEAYYAKVEDVYEAACKSISDYEHSFYPDVIKSFELSIQAGIDEVEFLCSEVEKLENGVENVEHSIRVLSEEAEKAILKVNDVMVNLRNVSSKISHDCSELGKNVDTCIVSLKRKIVWAKTLTMTHVRTLSPGSTTQSLPADHSSLLSHTPAHASFPVSSAHADNVSNGGGSDLSRVPTSQVSTSSVVAPVQMSNGGSALAQVPTSQVSASSVLAVPVHATSLSEQTVNMSVTHAYANRADNVSMSTPHNDMTGRQQRSTTNESQFVKAPLPTFNGNRTEWAEFRTIWRQYGATAYNTEADRAWALKQCLKGKALEHVKAIYITQPQAYERIWARLNSIYSDVSMCVQQAYDDLKKIKPVKQDDLRSLIAFINAVENCYSQLGEVQQLAAITMTHIDDLCDTLPLNMRMEWMRHYDPLPEQDKIHPFPAFMLFLENERKVAIRLSERNAKNSPSDSNKDKPKQGRTHAANAKSKQSSCLIHQSSEVKHKTENCNQFKKMSIKERKDVLVSHKACFRCLSTAHKRKDCDSVAQCKNCQHDSHHELLCFKQSNKSSTGGGNNSKEEIKEKTPSHSSETDKSKVNAIGCHAQQSVETVSLFAIQQAKVAGTNQKATLFFDSGSNTTYITHNAAKRLHARDLGKVTLNVIAMGNIESEYSTKRYSLKLITLDGTLINLTAYGMEEITSAVSELDMKVVAKLFPNLDNLQNLQRRAGEVDILVGNDYYGLHPKSEVARSGPNLSIMEGPFGKCLQGAHPKLKEQTCVLTNLASSTTFLCRSKEIMLDSYIQGEEIGTEIVPKCGGCRCGKCPIRGHSYSFKEEQELNLIRDNLTYDSGKQAWIAKYPWIIDPTTLPDNYSPVLATLCSTEKVLQKKGAEWSRIYEEQIQDMVCRGVARKLTTQELKEWDGPVFYISHLAVQNPKSATTPVRIVFNSSQKSNGVSLNEALAKGPDCYINNLLGTLLRWREGSAVLVGDIKKMFNSVHIGEVEQHCHRFLWRSLDTDRTPDIYVITRVNMGDKPAPAISAEAILKTAGLFESTHPRVASLLQNSIYVDDIVESVASLGEAQSLAADTEYVLHQGGFTVKGWQFSGVDPGTSSGTIRVLGIWWNPVEDNISFATALNFSQKVRGVHREPDLTFEEVPQSIPLVLSRRVVLEQVMRIYDPIGILSPFVVISKILLRQTWELKLGWDEPLPQNLYSKWILYFKEMAKLGALKYDRCVTPTDAIGEPTLIILSDASDSAYGFAAYIRWELRDQTFWCRLLLAKSRIAPIRKLSTPQLELNAAVLAKRGRTVIEKEMRLKFSKVYHLTDSETVLCMLHKLSTRFKLYEGVRIGEIQAATNGDMSEWHWICGKRNCADWITRGLSPSDIGPASGWWNGPDFLSAPVDCWGIKAYRDLDHRDTKLPGEKKMGRTHCAQANDLQTVAYDRFSSAKRLVWVFARILSIFRCKSFKGGATSSVTVADVAASKLFLIRSVQNAMTDLNLPNSGRYKSLKPIKDEKGIWVIGSRMSEYNPMTSSLSDAPPILLLNSHPYTKLLMHEAHVASGHRGRDATLARFRGHYWTPQGTKLAKVVKQTCQLCKLREPRLATQAMGRLPVERLQPSLPFSHVMLDFFGPYQIRGEVQKRTTGKAYGVIFTDLTSRAVHIEACFGYDASSFMLVLRRFTSIRGWPQVVFSDPGSQLVHTSKELKNIWTTLDKETIFKSSTDNGMRWVFGPADSPWYQGAVEALVKGAKRCLKFCFDNQRLSASEFMTVCYQTANILNERPLGRIPSDDSDINVLTPNSLLLGRATASITDSTTTDISSLKTRVGLVNLVAERFWSKWVELYAPTMITQHKWTNSARNFKVGDIVSVCDSNSLRSQYYIAEVKEVYPDKQGIVRRVLLRYKNYKVGQGQSTQQYSCAADVLVTRSVHRLALLVPVEIQ